MLDYIKKLTKELTQLNGLPSYEGDIRSFVKKELEGLGAELYTNKMGCLTATFKGQSDEKILLDAHMDEVGLIVQHITKSGFLKIVSYGSVDPRVVYASHFKVKADKIYNGVVGILPPHVLGGKEPNVIPLDKLYVDCGFKDKESVEKAGIRVGTPIYMVGEYSELEDDKFVTKAIDDRLGVAMLLSLAKNVLSQKAKSGTLKKTVTLSFSTQEEGGLRGISSVIERENPELAIVVETTTACDMPSVNPELYITSLGDGVAFSVADNYIYIKPELLDSAIAVAKKNNIKYQFKTPKFGGTNAGNIHTKKEGIDTLITSVPARYLHSPVSVASWRDVDNTYSFINKFLEEYLG